MKAATKTEIKKLIDAAFAEVDTHKDLTHAQRAQMRGTLALLLRAKIDEAHSAIPGMSKIHRIANEKARDGIREG